LILIVDTSVVVKWFVDEDGFATARKLIVPDLALIAPELVVIETANVMQRKARVGQLEEVQAIKAVASTARFFARLVPSIDLVEPAFTLSRLLDHSVYDCMFLALALRERDGRLVTSDEKFAGKAKAAGFGDRIWDLNVAGAAVATLQENGHG
jgi:predicted nucleic acid-binding protein